MTKHQGSKHGQKLIYIYIYVCVCIYAFFLFFFFGLFGLHVALHCLQSNEISINVKS